MKLSLFAFLLITAVQAKNLVKVDGVMITSDDLIKRKNLLNTMMPSTSILSDKYVLDTMVLYYLGLKEARLKNMESDPEAKLAMDTALFNYYMYKTIDEKITLMNVGEKELREQYKKDPELTFKRVIMPKSQRSSDSVKSKLSLYRSDINKGKSGFDDVIRKIGKHDLSSLSGTFTRISAYSLPEEERMALLKMQQGEISPVLDMGEYAELVQLTKRYGFAENSVQRLADSYKRDRLMEARLKIIDDLKAKYKGVLQYY